MFRTVWIGVWACMAALPAQAQVDTDFPGMHVMFVLDSSGSMWGQQDGRPKLEASREVIESSLSSMPPGAKAGLLAFGHRRKNDCSDVELLSPVGANDPQAIIGIATALKPKGISPIAAALQQAGDVLKPLNGGKMIFLISDGGEECGGDPCAVTRKLAEDGLIVRVNVVGFNMSDDARKELQCIAKEGAGRLFEVTDKVSLYRVMEEVRKEVETFPELLVNPPEPVVEEAAPELSNLLLTGDGVMVAEASAPGWEKTISGSDGAYLWTWAGQEVVFALKDKKSATVSRFAIGVPRPAPQNLKSFALYASDVSAEGPFQLIGRYDVSNASRKSVYQEFNFPPATLRYLKFKPLSNHGYPLEGWGDTQIFQLKLFGSYIEK